MTAAADVPERRSRPASTTTIDPSAAHGPAASLPAILAESAPPGGAAKRDEDRDARMIRYSSWAVALLFMTLAVVTLPVVAASSGVLAALSALVFMALGAAILVHGRVVSRLAERRGTREQSFTRILQGLSRSVSPESIVVAIVDELRRVSGADHVVVVRQSARPGQLEATLVSAGAAVPASNTRISADALRDGSGAPSDPSTAAEAIASRVRAAYGLKQTRSAALVAPDGSVIGALVLSRRTRDAWPSETRQTLGWAASEVSAALARAIAHQEASADARIDRLTGLPNRRYFEDLVAVLTTGRRASDALGILMVDIDHFKKLNDTYGHAIGDSVLHAVARQIEAAVRDEDTPARYGGEEFVVVLRRASPAQAVDVAERVRRAVAGPWYQEVGLSAPVTVSVGVAVASGETMPVEELVSRADEALYRAKDAGRDRVVTA